MKLLKLISMLTFTLLFVVSALAIPSKEEAAKLAAENQSELFTVGQSTTVTIGDEELPLDEADVPITIGFPGANLGQSHPVYDYYHHHASVSLYLASEIAAAGGSAGVITHLRWYCHTATTWTNGRQVWIYIKPTTWTAIPTGQTWATISAGATEVYNSGAQNYFGPGPVGWKEWDINDFTWNGTDNLLIMMRSYRPGYSSSTAPWRYQSGQTNRHWHRLVDAPDLGTTSGTLGSNRPTIELEIISAPNPPTDPSPANGATNIPTNPTLSWTPGANTGWMDVYFDTNNPPTTLVSDDQTGNTWSPSSNLNPNTQYFWRVHAFNNNGNTLGPVWSFTTGAGSSPNPPSGGYVDNATNSSLRMNWTDNSSDESAFDIYRSNNGSTFTYLTSVGANVTNYTNTGLGPNERWWYRVYSFGNGFQSTGFASGDGWTLCNTPGAPNVTLPAPPTGYTTVTITSLPADGNPATTLYRVGVKDTSNNFIGWVLSGGSPREATAANWNNINVGGLTSGQSYYFFASAKNGAGVFTDGPNSSLVTLHDFNIGGPDNYSYRYKTNFGPAGDPTVAFQWINLDNPTELVLSGDDNEANVSFGSFQFPFYGNIYNGGRMGTNCALALGVNSGDVGWSNTVLPTSATNICNAQAALFPFWDDHDWGGLNRCTYQNFGDYFVFQFTNSPRYGATTELATFQMILYNDGRIKYQYQSVTGTGWTPTIGIQGSATGAHNLFLQFASAQTSVIPQSGLAILFYRRANQPNVSTPPTNVSGGGTYSANGGMIDGFSFVGTPPAGSYVSTTEILNPNMYNVTGGLPVGYTPGSDPIAENLATGATASPVIVQILHNMAEPFTGFTGCLTFTVPNGVDPTTVRAAWRTNAGGAWTVVPNAAPYSYTFGPGQSITVCGLTHYSEWLLLSEDELLPVQMSSFTASAANSKVILNWRTESEVNNHHFNLYRSESPEVRGELIASIPGQGTSVSGYSYRYIDTRVVNGRTYYYRIADVDIDGVEAMYPIVVNATPTAGAIGIVPTEYSLSQNIPNPFNPVTEIRYAIKDAVKVELAVFDVNGREVAKLVDAYQTPNVYSVNFDATNLPAGVYFYQLRAGDFYAVKKMMLVK